MVLNCAIFFLLLGVLLHEIEGLVVVYAVLCYSWAGFLVNVFLYWEGIMRVFGLLGIGVAALVLVGCSTSPVLISEAKPVPPERIFVKDVSMLGVSQITVVRDTGMQAWGCYFGFYLDGQLAARLAAGERVSVGVAPGEHILGVGALCPIGEDERREIAAIFNPGDKKVYRLSMRGEGEISIEPTTLLQGR